MTARAPEAGFTLIEVIIAVAITSMMALMVMGTFRQVDRAHEITRDQGDRYAAAQLALSRLSRELSMAYLSDHYDKTTNRSLRERPTAFIGKDDELLFTTFAHERLARDAKESDQEAVEYTVGSDPDEPGEEVLFRRQKSRIDEELDRGGRKDVVADHVTSFRLQYFDPKRNDWVREWSTKSTEHPNDLPTRVRVELEFKLPAGRTEKLSTEARITLLKTLDF
jgi:general secretion pathway protein J